VKDVGEPGAGEPHARIDGRGLETERYGVTAPALDPTILIRLAPVEFGSNVRGHLPQQAHREWISRCPEPGQPGSGRGRRQT
jgi:hypothetical protein